MSADLSFSRLADSPGHEPGVPEGMPQFSFFAGDAVYEEIDCFPGEERRNHFGRQIGTVVGVM